MIKRIIALILPIMIFYIGPVYADQMINMEQIMFFRNMPHFSPTGNIRGVYFSIDNEGLHLKPYLNQYTTHYDYLNGEHEDITTITGGYIKLLDENDMYDYLSFPLDKWPYFRAYKLRSESGREFLLIIKGKQGTSENDANGVWLVGKKDGKYITYASLDNLQGAGLVYQDIIPKIENGELRLIGIARDRDCNIWGRYTDQPPYTYKGHPVSRTEMANKGECVVSSVNLFWDDNANWFGIRYAE